MVVIVSPPDLVDIVGVLSSNLFRLPAVAVELGIDGSYGTYNRESLRYMK